MKNIFVLIFFFIILSCGRVDENSKAYLELSRYIGERVTVDSNDLIRVNLKTEPQKQTVFAKRCKLYFYIDSAKCTECKVAALRKIENAFNELNDENFTIVTIIKGDDYLFAKKEFETYQISTPVFIDSDNSIKKKNAVFPDKDYLNIFLTINDTIVALGSPVDNPKLINLYKKHINR